VVSGSRRVRQRLTELDVDYQRAPLARKPARPQGWMWRLGSLRSRIASAERDRRRYAARRLPRRLCARGAALRALNASGPVELSLARCSSVPVEHHEATAARAAPGRIGVL